MELRSRPVFCNLQPLILASESPRRSQLLRSVGLALEVIPSGVEEWESPDKEPAALVKRRAYEKARAVSFLHPRSWVLSADTIVVHRDTILGKPTSAEEASAMLQRLNGQMHQVFSGVCLSRYEPAFIRIECFRTDVGFRMLSDAEIGAYVKTGEPFDKAGAYGIQGMGAFLVKSVNGSYTNVVGLPLCEVVEWLTEQRIIAPA